jgi:hypothetical protein
MQRIEGGAVNTMNTRTVVIARSEATKQSSRDFWIAASAYSMPPRNDGVNWNEHVWR